MPISLSLPPPPSHTTCKAIAPRPSTNRRVMTGARVSTSAPPSAATAGIAVLIHPPALSGSGQRPGTFRVAIHRCVTVSYPQPRPPAYQSYPYLSPPSSFVVVIMLQMLVAIHRIASTFVYSILYYCPPFFRMRRDPAGVELLDNGFVCIYVLRALTSIAFFLFPASVLLT